MSLLFRVIYAAHCRGTHHKLAMDALNRLEGPGANRWRKLILKHYDAFLLGAKAPDTRFKDFYNHVLYVENDDWGGAPEAARLWCYRAVETLKKRHWVNGIYALGVLTHYYTDPIQPFHTGQSAAANQIHRAVEWSISKAYDEIWTLAEQNERPAVNVPDGENWLEEMVKQGAEFAHPYYQTLIDRYDFDPARHEPTAGLDQVSREILAKLLAYAVAGSARILDRVFQETELTPPRVFLPVPTVLATLQIPLQFVTKRILDRRDRAQVQAIYEELESTGSVEEHLPDDDRAVRDLFYADWPELAPPGYAAPQKPETEPSSTLGEEESAHHLPFHLDLSDPVDKAPSIGPKTARRLRRVRIQTVADLLAVEPEEAANRLHAQHITPEVFRDWQDQARLVCRVPKLRGHEAQILIACGFRDPLDISTAPTAELLLAAAEFAQTGEGQRLIRPGKAPDETQVSNWQNWASQARELKAA